MHNYSSTTITSRSRPSQGDNEPQRRRGHRRAFDPVAAQRAQHHPPDAAARLACGPSLPATDVAQLHRRRHSRGPEHARGVEVRRPGFSVGPLRRRPPQPTVLRLRQSCVAIDRPGRTGVRWRSVAPSSDFLWRGWSGGA